MDLERLTNARDVLRRKFGERASLKEHGFKSGYIILQLAIDFFQASAARVCSRDKAEHIHQRQSREAAEFPIDDMDRTTSQQNVSRLKVSVNESQRQWVFSQRGKPFH